MSSNDQSDIGQSPTLPLPSSVSNQEEYIERVVSNRGLRIFLVVDHTANLRKNSKISAIWHHGGERRRLDDNSMARYWRCHHCTGSATVLKWWTDESRNGNYDTLHLYALDHLSCPVMATQCERVFSAAKRTLTPERNEACECLRWWWRNGVVTGIAITCPTATRVHTEAQLVTALLGDAGAVEEDVD
jgi:hypothetical protein